MMQQDVERLDREHKIMRNLLERLAQNSCLSNEHADAKKEALELVYRLNREERERQ